MAATWYRLELDGGERFVEVDMDMDGMRDAIQRGDVVRTLRQVAAVPMQGDDGRMHIRFALIERLSPLVEGCERDTEHMNLGRVVAFARVDTSGEIWQMVREGALREPGIVTPPKGIIMPGGD